MLSDYFNRNVRLAGGKNAGKNLTFWEQTAGCLTVYPHAKSGWELSQFESPPQKIGLPFLKCSIVHNVFKLQRVRLGFILE